MQVKKMVATAAIALSAFAAGAHVAHSTYENPFATVCKSEDSNGCRWDGSKQGNGHGESYVVTKSGNVFYFDKSMSEHPSKPFYGIKHKK
jgi:hypothetical protein